MTCGQAKAYLQDWVDGERVPDAAREHAAACPDCAREAEALRSWGAELGVAMRREAGFVEPAPGAAARAAAAMASAPQRASFPRLAAAVAVALSAGLVAAAVLFQPPSPTLVAEAASQLEAQRRDEAELRFLQDEIRRDLAVVRKTAGPRAEEQPSARAVLLGAWTLEDRLAPGTPPPVPVRTPVVTVTQTVGGSPVTVTQAADGKVTVTASGRNLEARSMGELQRSHADICRTLQIGGREGFIVVGQSSAGADWKGQIDLQVRVGSWEDALPWEAHRSWLAATLTDAAAIESRLKASQERARRNAAQVPPFAYSPNGEALRREVEALTRRELERNRERMEEAAKRLRERLEEARRLHERVRGLRAVAEEVTRD